MLGGADAKRWRCHEVHYMRMRPHGASELDDLEKFVDRGGGSLSRMNEVHGFGIELVAIDVAADRND